MVEGLQPETSTMFKYDNKKKDERCVAIIRFVGPQRVDLFSFRLILLERPVNGYREARTFEGRECGTFTDTAVAMGLYRDGKEYEKSLDEAVRNRFTPSGVRYLFVNVSQHGADVKRTFEKHEAYMASHIRERSVKSKRKELSRRLFKISDTHGGQLL